MSASRERKKRAEQGNTAPVEQPKKKKKLSEGLILLISVVLVLAIVFGGVMIYKGHWAGQTIMQVGEHIIQPAQFNYFYRAQINNISSYVSYMGIDTGKPLKEQKISASGASMLTLFGMDLSDLPELKEGAKEYDITWAEFFARSAARTAAAYYGVYDLAQAAGFQLSEDATKEIDEEITSLATVSRLYSMSSDEYLSKVFGSGCNAENYREYLKVAKVYTEYPLQLRDGYTADEIQKRYDEDNTAFDSATFWLYTVKASDFVKKDSDGKTPDISDENRTSAKEAAEKMLKDFNTEDEKAAWYADYLHERVKSMTNEEAADWLFKTAKADGENVKLFQKEFTTDSEKEKKDDTYYVLKLVTNEFYDTAKLVQIFVKADSSSSTTTDTSKTEANRVIEIMKSLDEDASREAFVKIASDTKQSDVTGDYELENVTRTQLASYQKMASWVFDEARKEGDWMKFDTDDGTFILYFDGYGQTNRDYACRNAILSDWLEKVTKETFEASQFSVKNALHADVGLYV